MPHVEVSRVVAADAQTTFELLTHMDEFPRYMESVESVEVLSRAEGRTETRWVCKLQGSTFRWVEEDIFLPEEGRITYRQTEGDLRRFEGEWRLEPTEKGTSVTLVVDFEFGIPMIASLLNPIAAVMLRRNVESMLKGVDKAVSEKGGIGSAETAE